MASLVENLMEVLNRECSEYDMLLQLSERKTSIIVKGDLPELERITDDEQTVVSKINHLDKDRAGLMKDIASVMNRDVATFKLIHLIQILESRPEEYHKLTELHDRLQSIAGRMKRVNEQNGELLRNSLDMVNFDMNLIQAMKAAPETANYNKGAYNTGAVLSSEHAGFDTKQ